MICVARTSQVMVEVEVVEKKKENPKETVKREIDCVGNGSTEFDTVLLPVRRKKERIGTRAVLEIFFFWAAHPRRTPGGVR